jgi:hypothetical protein
MKDRVGTAAVLILIVVSGVWAWDGWSPLNLLLGPQWGTHSAPPEEDTRATFVRETIPTQYPRLLAFLGAHGPETVRWKAQSGDPKEQVLSVTQTGLLIETSVHPVPEAGQSAEPIMVSMTDDNLDGALDAITYTESSGGRHSYAKPFDETSLFLWDSALAIAFRFGDCCR